MTTFSKLALSGSTNGKGIPVTATATPGTLIHTAVAGTSDYDEIWLWVTNIDDAADVKITIEYGGVAAGDQIEYTVAFEEGLKILLPGNVLQNSLVVRAFASTTALLNVHGFVNRIAAT